MSLIVDEIATRADLKRLEDRISEDREREFSKLLEIIQQGPTIDIPTCAKLMKCTSQTALKRIRNAGIKMNEDGRPMIVDTKEFVDALWSNKIKS